MLIGLDGFYAHLILWLLSLGVGGILIWQNFLYRHKESKLPLACEYDDLEGRLSYLQEEFNSKQEEVVETRSLIAERDQAKVEIAHMMETHGRYQEELLGLEEQYKQKEVLTQEIEETLVKLAAKHQELKNHDVEFAQMKTTYDQYREEVTKLNEECRNLHQEIEDSKKSYKELKDSENVLQQNVKRLNSENEVLVTAGDKVKSELEVMEKEFSSVQGHVSALNVEFQHLLAQKKILQKDKQLLEDSHQSTIQSIEKHWKKLEEHAERATKAIKESIEGIAPADEGKGKAIESLYPSAESLVIKAESYPKPSRKQLKEEECLERVTQYLQESGLYFPDRIIRSFHTSLKTNDISPLVVLSGISGTGKSALPMRYAEAMGIHLLNIPIQPRFDGPQDLLGFYNYLEKQFKATDLSRSLVQMDRYNKSAPEGWKGNLSDRMLLVMLDEMNLARTEYYFSEFLSKLETRRGLNKDRPFERRQAEIFLETNTGSCGGINLFVDNNVLFVGTMNNDETTQSLSDKVLDRANVLQFGRPTKTRNMENKPKPKRAESPLLFDQWNNWLVDPGKRALKELDSKIHQVNDAMALIGKPFGYRVIQSIKSYVANYPSEGMNNSQNIAFADQLEQKIMPKLRSVDCEEKSQALDDMERVIQGLKVDSLSEAFQKARESEFFDWQGCTHE